MKYEIYKATNDEWRWRFRAANGLIIAVSSEGYRNESDCRHSIDLVKGSVDAPIEHG